MKYNYQQLFYPHIAGMIGMHLALPVLIVTQSVNWLMVIIFAFLFTFIIAQMTVAMGYHKLFSHRSFVPVDWYPKLLTFVGIAAGQYQPFGFAVIHRAHHKNSDKDSDPHTPKNRWYHAYFGQFFIDSKLKKYYSKEELSNSIKDLIRDYPWVKYLNFWTEWAMMIFVLVLFYTISTEIFIAWIAGSVISLHAGSAVNTFCHPTINGKTEIIDLPVLRFFVGATCNHKYHHDHPELYDESANGITDVAAIIVRKFLIKK